MSVIRQLLVNLSANTASFNKAMASASGKLASFAKDAGAAAAKVAAWGSALTAAATGGGLTLLTKSSMEAIDTTAKVADRLGITTEALVGLRHGAGLAGVDVETFDGALTKMTKNLGEAAISGGPVADTLKALGLDAQQLAGMSPDQAFLKLSDAIDGLASPYEKVNVAMDIFGKQGAGIINVMQGGSAAVKDMIADAEQLGLTFNRVDGAKVEAANDALERMWKIFTGLGNQIAIQLAPFIEVAANKLTDLGIKGLDGGKVVTTAFEWIAKSIAWCSDFLNIFGATWYALKGSVQFVTSYLIDAIDWVGQGIVDLINKIPGMSVEWTDTFKGMGDALREMAEESFTEFDKSWSAFSNGENQQKVKSFFDNVRAEADKAAKDLAAKNLAKTANQSAIAQAMQQIEADKKAAKERETQLKKEAEEKERREKAMRKKIYETEQDADPMYKLAARYSELGKMLDAGLSQSAYDKQLKNAIDEYQSATGGTKEAGGIERIGQMGIGFYADQGQSQKDILRGIKQTLERIEKQGYGNFEE